MQKLRPTDAQRKYLQRGLKEPGGKLPIFDENGQEINAISDICKSYMRRSKRNDVH